jgi:hypothetical protein
MEKERETMRLPSEAENAVRTGPIPLISAWGEKLAKESGQFVDWRGTKMSQTQGAKDTDPFRLAAREILRQMHHQGMHSALDFLIDIGAESDAAAVFRELDQNRQRNRRPNAQRERPAYASQQSRSIARDAAADSEVAEHRSYGTFDGWIVL